MLRRSALIILMLAASLPESRLRASESGPCADQSSSSTYDASVPLGRRRGTGPANEGIPAEMQKKQAEARNKERQAALKKDTDELFRLANDLKQKVDQTNENQLSVSVIKATEKIEKLAKSVREKMQANGYCDFVGQ